MAVVYRCGSVSHCSDHSWRCLPQPGTKCWGEGILRMEDAGTSEEDDIDSQDSNTPIDHGYVAWNCSIKILLLKTTGITASLACTFARHVAHRTCLWYGWSATYLSGSSSTYSWWFVNLHTSGMEGHSPGRYPGPLLFHATTHRETDWSAWRLQHHIEITCSQTMYSSVILIVCLFQCQPTALLRASGSMQGR